MVLGREGVDTHMSRTFYVAVAQKVLINGSETWFI